MSKTLTVIAQDLKNANKKVQLIYAFNGTGKTRLSREFKELIAPKDAEAEEQEESFKKILYYNAFTEDLFYWDNDLATDTNRKLKIHPNKFTGWVLRVQGQDQNIINHFKHYTNDKLKPSFNNQYDEVTFSIPRDNNDAINNDAINNDAINNNAINNDAINNNAINNDAINNVKISKGEESCLIWCVFYSLLEQAVENLNIPEPAERDTDKFDELQYVFIDDPVSSLDDNHLIELAVNIAELIKSSKSDLKFIITTHNPLFYNVLFNEFNGVKRILKKRFAKLEDGTYILEDTNDSPFSYHLLLLSELEKAIESNDIKKYHFNFLRNILEKTSTFLGYASWQELLPKESHVAYYNRIINLYSHSKHSEKEDSTVKDDDKRMLSFLVQEIKRVYGFK